MSPQPPPQPPQPLAAAPSSPPSPPPSSNSSNSALPALHHALSGSLGTLVSTCSLYPLSLVVARLQVQRQLRHRRGDRGRRRPSPGPSPSPSPSRGPGPPPAAPGAAPTGPRHLPTSTPAPTSPPPPPNERAATAAAPAPAPAPLPPPPAEYAGIADAFSRIWSFDGNGGPRAFYTGLAQDAPKSVLDSFLFFLFYEWFRALRLGSRRRRTTTAAAGGRGLGVVEELAVGMAAGACSRAITTPIANVVTRKQMATLLGEGDSDGGGVRDIARRIRADKGLVGFWSGYSASLVLTLNPSLTFFLQEFLRTTFAAEQACDDDPAPPWLTFLLAATSKAVSSFVTYPFQIAKTSLQAGIPLTPDEEEEPSGIDGADSKKTDRHSDEEEGGEDVEKNQPDKPKPIRVVQTLAQRSIFGTVAHIIRTEGIGPLYDGIGAELLKGFFSHGTTMVAKDVVHKLLFKLYIFAIGAMAELRTRRGVDDLQ
ncbi:mitochondrial carrier domain-containing protein [Xylaria palmicola]|nr:mitochondrial carrier domain-containing protein [Xylaria palmicola]